MLLFSGASERGRFLGESLQLKVTQCVVVVFEVLARVQMLPFSAALRLPHILCSITCQFANMIPLCVYSATLRLPHILCSITCQFANMIPLCVYSATLRLPHILFTPRHSKWNRIVAFYLEIYACLTALIQTLKTSIMQTSFHYFRFFVSAASLLISPNRGCK